MNEEELLRNMCTHDFIILNIFMRTHFLSFVHMPTLSKKAANSFMHKWLMLEGVTLRVCTMGSNQSVQSSNTKAVHLLKEIHVFKPFNWFSYTMHT